MVIASKTKGDAVFREGVEYLQSLASAAGFISSDDKPVIDVFETHLSVTDSKRQWAIGCNLFGHTPNSSHDLFVEFNQVSGGPVKPSLKGIAQLSIGGGDSNQSEKRVDRVIDGEGNVLAKVMASSMIEEQQWRHLGFIVGLLQLDFSLDDVVLLSRSLMDVSRGTWPVHYHDFAEALEPDTLNSNVEAYKEFQSLKPFNTLRTVNMGVYPVVDSVEWIERLLIAGVTTLQLRIKNPSAKGLERDIEKAIELGNRFGAQLFINDHWALAIKYGAYGIHLGQEDLLCADLSAIQAQGIRLGLSTHGYYELLRVANISPSYIALGHIFPTTTKQMPSLPQGIHRLERYQCLVNSILPVDDRVQRYPTVAIGGINLENASEVLGCGVSTIAVVRAVTEASDLMQALDQFEQLITRAPGENHANGQ